MSEKIVYTPESNFETRPVEVGCEIVRYRGKGGDLKIPPVCRWSA